MSSARHEAGHVVAIHLLNLAEILRPGGAAIKDTAGGLVTLDCESPSAENMAAIVARVDCTSTAPCAPVVEAARERPDLVPDLLTFTLAGYGANAGRWAGDLMLTVEVRRSSDFETARRMILDVLGNDGPTAQAFTSETTRDALDRAVEWTARPEVRALINRVAAHLESHRAATWSELSRILSAQGDRPGDESPVPLPSVSGDSPLAGVTLEPVTGAAPPAAAETSRAELSANHNEERSGMTNAHE